MRLERRDREAHVRDPGMNERRRLKKEAQIVLHLLSSRTRQNCHQSAGLLLLRRKKRLVELLPSHFVEKRVAYKGRAAALLAKPCLLKGQRAQDVVHALPHLL